ncbi:MAG: hypothetical protein NUW01_11375, partial [Gemmatimonadaceae bacterium]|nr:hypothetical protein [Gemmatimonadaceae bacterium]
MLIGSRRVALLGKQAIPYLWGPFQFGGALAAPLSSPYTESGAKGSMTLVQTDGEFSTSVGKLAF